MTDIATSWWRRRVPARPWSPHSTTAACAADETGASAVTALRRASPGDPGAVACGPIARCWPTRTSASSTSAGVRPERWRHVFACVQSLPSYGIQNIPADAYEVVVIDEFHHAEATTYRRILDHLNPRSCSASPRRPNAATALTCAASSVAAPPPSFGCGMPSAPTCCAPSTTSPSRTARTCAGSAGRGAVRRARTVQPLHRQRARAGHRAQAAPRQGRRPGCHAGARVLRQRRATRSSWPTSSTKPGSRRAQSAATPRRPSANARCRTSRTGESTCSSPSTCSTKGSTYRTSTPCCSCGRPRAPRSSCSSSAAGCVGPETRPCSPSSTSSATTARSSASTQSCAR